MCRRLLLPGVVVLGGRVGDSGVEGGADGREQRPSWLQRSVVCDRGVVGGGGVVME